MDWTARYTVEMEPSALELTLFAAAIAIVAWLWAALRSPSSQDPEESQRPADPD